MAKYKCEACGYVYDSAKNSGIELDELADSWTCPMCGAGKEHFV